MADVLDAAGQVEVHLFAAARAAVGASMVTVGAGSLGSVLDEIESRHPEFAGVRPRCSFLLDEVSCSDLHALVHGGSRVDVLPPFAGG
ncbi:MAG: MoaD/ThiS family protein [Candidatus Nanopelagicales bacterium]|nr:MoaD/ThiS family protein [Candidatus Nanopelagicales bacterium]MCF8536900.1 MoaD/ThiS family protein [Candidatus Nanopelagicales bacterium]MCF8542030.1 MoaD/ThiS family protein [Candidatus Nanopelagicales bacterium]MCF8556718.1 MoaD/ThiS family protein [Candidatus Nanopelagicales bacterium]